MGERGVVTGVSGNRLTITLARSAACAHCCACAEGTSAQEMILIAKNRCGARKGDSVNIETEMKYTVKTIAILYGIPLILLVAGIALGYFAANVLGYAQNSELAAVITGAAVAGLALAVIRINDKRIKKLSYIKVATAVIK